jgi:hypothetical protein
MCFFCFCVKSRRQMMRAKTRGRQPSNRTRISRGARPSRSFSLLWHIAPFPSENVQPPASRNPGLLGWLSQHSSWLVYILVFITGCPVNMEAPLTHVYTNLLRAEDSTGRPGGPSWLAYFIYRHELPSPQSREVFKLQPLKRVQSRQRIIFPHF